MRKVWPRILVQAPSSIALSAGLRLEEPPAQLSGGLRLWCPRKGRLLGRARPARICCLRFLGDQLDLPMHGSWPPNLAFLILREGWSIDLKTLRWCLLPPLGPADIVQCSLKARCWVGRWQACNTVAFPTPTFVCCAHPSPRCVMKAYSLLKTHLNSGNILATLLYPPF